MRGLIGLLAGIALALTTATVAMAQTPPSTAPRETFSDWAAVVVAGDFHAHSGGPTAAFDNARRDVAQALVDQAGFSPANVKQFSVRPDRFVPRPETSTLFGIYEGLKTTAAGAKAGCLFYLTSHGARMGAYLANPDEDLESVIYPVALNELIGRACPDRPTVVVISTCFSGVNVPALKGENRMILTAAAEDRSSFGCGESDKYPFFDDCFLKTLKTTASLATLGPDVLVCVAKMEKSLGASPPSNPQLWIGTGIKDRLPLYALGQRR